MKPVRTLILKREHLAELADEDLRHVVGGHDAPTLPLNVCLSRTPCPITEDIFCMLSVGRC